MRKGRDDRARAEYDVFQHAVRAHAHAIAQHALAFNQHIDVNHHILPAAQRAAQIKARRVPQGHAVAHQPLRLAVLESAFQRRQLRAVIDAGGEMVRRHLHRAHRHALARRHRNQVGQIQLALRIGRTQRLQPRRQPRIGQRQYAGVDFAQPPLRIIGVFFFHNRRHAAIGVTHDAPVTKRVVQHIGEHAQRLAARRRQQRRKAFRVNQRHVAIEHQRLARLRQIGQHHLQRVPRAALFGLFHPLHRRIRKCLAHLLRLVANHHMHRLRTQRRSGLQHPRQHRFAADFMQHFRACRTHPRPLPRRQNHHMQRFIARCFKRVHHVQPSRAKRATKSAEFYHATPYTHFQSICNALSGGGIFPVRWFMFAFSQADSRQIPYIMRRTHLPSARATPCAKHRARVQPFHFSAR